MPIKVVLFDLDETLFDHVYSRQSALKAVHTAYECFAPYAYPQFETDYTAQIEELWIHILEKTMTLETRLGEGFRRLAQYYNLQFAESECAAMASHYRQTYLQARQAVPGAIPLLELLKPHVKIGIITNHIEEEQLGKIAASGMDHLVDFLVCSGELGIHKPDRRIFEHALELAHCTPQEAVMIGDSWSADVVGAAGVGMRAVWLNRHQRPCPDPALAIEINSLEPAEEIAKILLDIA